MRFYVHGGGRGGREAWPGQSEEEAVFADHSAYPLMTSKVDVVGEQCPSGGAVVVAHSLGAAPVALAHQAGALAASHVVLLEPALYDIARGAETIERHIDAMTQARTYAAAGDLSAFWQIVAPLMFGREATREAWQDDLPLARRFSDMDTPWGHGIHGSVFATVPTLVITGDWSDEYEAIAQHLTASGVRG